MHVSANIYWEYAEHVWDEQRLVSTYIASDQHRMHATDAVHVLYM